MTTYIPNATLEAPTAIDGNSEPQEHSTLKKVLWIATAPMFLTLGAALLVTDKVRTLSRRRGIPKSSPMTNSPNPY